MPIQRVTTTSTLKENQGQMCQRCQRRSPLCQWLDGTGWVCSDCDPRDHPVRVVPDDTPVDRGRG
jgi:hypothetical protein